MISDRPVLLPLEEQIRSWRRANRAMNWGIDDSEFSSLSTPAGLTSQEIDQGFIGSSLCYGFVDDGRTHGDSILSGQKAWEYARKLRSESIWETEYVHFEETDSMRLRSGAPPRPKGFYHALIHWGERYRLMTVAQARAFFRGKDTGLGPEGLQLLCVTHNHLAMDISRKLMPPLALADYDVAPYGYGDFYDAPHLFADGTVLGLGIINIDHKYPNIGIPFMRFVSNV